MLTKEIELFGKHPQKITINKMTNVFNDIYHEFHNDFYTFKIIIGAFKVKLIHLF